jgi:hypothetical protein
MNFNVLKDFYLQVRNTLVWFVVYFFAQAIIWITVAVLIWLYPQTINVLATIALAVLSLVSVYFGILFTRMVLKLKDLKDAITKFKF